MEKFRCDHCKQKFKESELFTDENGLRFCCNGCKQVFYLLKSSGLNDEFYEKLGKNTLNPANIQKASEAEVENIYKNYVKKNENGFDEVFLIIEGLHCSACVWLNEKVLINAPGVLEMNINASTGKAKIIWDENETSLAKIFMLIESIGYRPMAYDPLVASQKITNKKTKYYAKLLVGIFATMNMMWISIALYSGYFSGIDQGSKDIFHFAEFILATPVLFYTGSVFFAGAKIAIKNKTPNMDLLIAFSASLTYIYSLYAMFSRNGEVYFDSVCMIITFVFIGKFLEISAQKYSTDTLDKISNFIVNDILVKQGDKFQRININEIKKGDIILINSGEKVLIDGRIISGQASFDYASLSGESLPLYKESGDEITSGAICIDGSVEYTATSDFQSSVFSKIINLLQNATLQKTKIEVTVNKIAKFFTPTVITLAIIAFVGWWFSGESFERSLMIFISVLVIACPCALGLATPVASLVGLGIGLKKGIIFKESKVIETLAKCNTIVFDKTGTLSKAKLKITNAKFYAEFDKNLLLNLLISSTHPVSVCVLEYLKNSGEKLKKLEFDELENIPAKGVRALFEGKKLNGGSLIYMNELGLNPENSDKTNYFFAIDGEILAKFELEDELRDDTKASIERLKKLGFDIHILSGDNEATVVKVALKLGVKNYKAHCLPDDKSEFVKSLISQNKNVVMVGDGINDSLALSLANVGVCLGSGATISVEKSDIILIKDSLSSLVSAVEISKKTYRIIKQNLAFCLLYNSLTIPIAAAGYIIPLFAAISMSLSSLVVVLNSLRIRYYKEKL
ncbi:MAG: cadmium-translocating P-type ATPase [Campylobacter sp.]|nr:cadmium-translocating P-type ATPase [Campylobacter sp.]